VFCRQTATRAGIGSRKENQDVVAEIGLYCLILAFLASLLQASLPLWGAARNDAGLMRIGDMAALTCFALVAAAFALLTTAFVRSDFSVALVADHSQLAKPLVYKISGVWANHEGSMLLWVLILTLFGAAIAWTGDNMPAALKARVIGIQGLIGVGFLAFVLFTSNPFVRLATPPVDGNGLNPLLQDPGLALHPPFLYLGYVGFSVSFSFAVAALLGKEVDAAWARWVRPWVLAAWTFLTIGITLGSFWAYYVLGWGGWWFWDPVENVSFMPWLAGTALLHSALVVERRHALVNWTLLLAILTFSLSLVGAFVVRSGILTSVHAFATDPDRGLFILALLVLITGGALTVYGLRINDVKQGVPFAPVSREGSLVLNNVVLMAATASVFAGTFYPLVVDMLGTDKISVGPPFYNKTFLPIMLPLLIAMVVGPMLNWKRDELKQRLLELRWPLLLAAGALFATVLFAGTSFTLTAIGMGLGAWIVAGSLWVMAKRMKLGRASFDTSLSLARTAPRAFYGLILGHMGLGILALAITVVSSFSQENILAMKPGETTQIAGYEVKFTEMRAVQGPNYDAKVAMLEVTQDGRAVTTLVPQLQSFTNQRQQISQTSIHTNMLNNLYSALGEANPDGKYTVRLYWHPMAPWLWLGALLMAFGGFISLSDRRFRIGAPMRTSATPVVA
jgi:cytochrome c-type biogenesis protein CcmF